MDDKNLSSYSFLWSKSNKSTKDKRNIKRQEFWNGTLVDDYNFLMSEELICRCRGSLGEPFTSLNDLSVHHVSYNEFEKQYGELSHWCEKIYDTITKISANALTRYHRQKYYEELYEQGLMRLRMFGQYADKLIERFPDLKLNIDDKMMRINRQWNFLESRFIDYLDEDFDRIIQDLHNELDLFEEWLSKTEEKLWIFESIRTDDISLEEFQLKLHQHTKLQDDIKSRNSRVSSIIEICERLRNDYEQQADQVPFDFASDLENRWHQIWINSVEIQCKLEDRLKFLKNSIPFIPIDEQEKIEEEDDIIPFYSSEYEKIPLTSSISSVDSLNCSINKHKREQFSLKINLKKKIQSKSFVLKRKMATSNKRMSLNILPINPPSTLYYSLTNINDFDDQIITKKQKKTLSILDVGYESEDENNRSDKNFPRKFRIKKSFSDYLIGQKSNYKNTFISLTHSLPSLEENHLLPTWWRHSITSAYDTCSNPDIDLSIEETKKHPKQTSLLMYSRKYTKLKRIQMSKEEPSKSNVKQKKSSSNPTSNSYDASAEYTDPDQSENDVDVLSSDFNSTSPVHNYKNSQFYNRYTTTTTTTTGYSSDIELETTTLPSETEEQQTQHDDEMSRKKIDALNLPSTIISKGCDSLNTIIMNEKIESSEPCWDGYQNPLFYPLNSQDIDSIETTLKWEDQFLEMEQPNNSSSDNENYLNENFVHLLRNIDSSSSSFIAAVTGSIGKKQNFDSDSDLDDFNYVLNETERQLFKARQSLEKKKRQQSFAVNDRNLRKYDEVLRTCETNIQCLQKILKNLHRSKNSRLNSTKTIEQLQTYLSGWHDMRQQVNNERLNARQLLHISQGIIKLKLRLDEELARINSINNLNHQWSENNSLSELISRINNDIETEKDFRQKLALYRTDLAQNEENLSEYRMTNLDNPSSSNIDEHLNSCHLVLEQLTEKMDTYQTQLRTISKIVDSLISIERQIEQRLTSSEFNNNFQIEFGDCQRLMDKYEELMNNLNPSLNSINDLFLKIKTHCQSKLEIYKKMLNDIFRKSQSKHVSFDGSINLNNNNSSMIINSSSSSTSSTSSTPQQYTNDVNQNQQQTTYRRIETVTETNDFNQNSNYDTQNKKSSTSSYISDDCKVLYIETVIEVAKPVFYERTNETVTTKDTEYHHKIPQSTINTQQSSSNNYYINSKQKRESSDDESNKPVNSTLTSLNSRKNKIQHIDSGIEFDQITPPISSSSTTVFNRRTIKQNNNNHNNEKILFPSITTNSTFDDPSKTSVVRRANSIKTNTTINKNNSNHNRLNSSKNLYWNRLRQTWLRALLIGLMLLFILFFIYLFRIDSCSRSAIIRTVCRKIISIDNEGLPTI